MNWDAKVHTNDPNRSAILVTVAATKDEAEQNVREHIKNTWPDVTIRDLVVEPSVLDRHMNRKQRRAK